MHASMSPAAEHAPCTAAIVTFGKSRIRTQLVPVHDLLVVELALGRGAHRGPVLLAREDLLEVVAGREVLALAREHDHPHLVVGVGAVERGIELVDQLGVLRVRRLGPVQRDRAHRPVDLVADRPPNLTPSSESYGFGSRGRPSTRSPMMLRWISFVPAQIDDAW